jgi:hypothetical protein
MQHTSMEKNTLTTAEAVPVLLWVPRSRGLSRSQIMLASMTAGFVVGVLSEISGEALFSIPIDEETWSRMLLWCLANSILCMVVMEGLLGLSGKRRPKYGLMPIEVSFLCAHIITTNAVHVVAAWCLVGSNDSFWFASIAIMYVLIAVFCLMKLRTHEDDDDEDEKNSFIEEASTV